MVDVSDNRNVSDIHGKFLLPESPFEIIDFHARMRNKKQLRKPFQGGFAGILPKLLFLKENGGRFSLLLREDKFIFSLAT